MSVALVSGGGRGIGRAIALSIAADGMAVAGARSERVLQEFVTRWARGDLDAMLREAA